MLGKQRNTTMIFGAFHNLSSKFHAISFILNSLASILLAMKIYYDMRYDMMLIVAAHFNSFTLIKDPVGHDGWIDG